MGGEGRHGGQGRERSKKINLLPFRDDWKVYGANCWESLLEMQTGVKIVSKAIELPDSRATEKVDSDGHKYHGVLEGAGVIGKEMKDIIRKE